MPQNEDFDDDGDQVSEGIRSLREELKRVKAEQATAVAALEAEKTARLAVEGEKRQGQVVEALKAVGLSERLAKHFPADAALESIAAWATEEFGVAPQVQEPEQGSLIEKYNHLIQQGYTRAGETGEKDLLRQVQEDTRKALNSKFRPTDEEMSAARKNDHKINEINRRMEVQVGLGRAVPFEGGFGGRFSPPVYANRTLEA